MSDADRAAFEARLNKSTPCFDGRNDFGFYVDSNVADWWKVWQAALAAQAARITSGERHRNDLADKIVEQKTDIGALKARIAELGQGAAQVADKLHIVRDAIDATFNDPMWHDHAEVSKGALKRWTAEIDAAIATAVNNKEQTQ